jgi:hypothetical protein
MRSTKTRLVLASAVLAYSFAPSSTQAQYGPPRSHAGATGGAVIGGVTGAAIGGIVGHQKDKAGKGALIGGAVGAIAGAAIGNEKDKQTARQYSYNNGYHSQGHYHVQPVPTRTIYSTPTTYPSRTHIHTTRVPVTISEVANMTQSGVSDHVIISHIQANGVAARPSSNDIVFLSQHGVSDAVISALQGNYSYSPGIDPGANVHHHYYAPAPAVRQYAPPPSNYYYPTDRRGF